MSTSPAPPEADRGLLLGVLALQLDFVGRADLQNALHDWAADRSRPFAHLLVERGALAPRRRALLDDVTREYLVQYDGDVAHALSAACAARTLPIDLDGLSALGVRAEWATLPSSPGTMAVGGGDESCSAAVGLTTSSGLRFRILRPHARGALGVVYLALDEELHREVALKEIQDPYHRSPDSRARFLLEAEVTGSLEHPGIVPVYGLGCHPDGRPYYAMRFIKGESFNDAIARFHQADLPSRDPGERTFALRGLLRRFIDVCNALSYAHSRNVIHRDVKPSNVMLGPYGETLVVDWGLAKVLDRPSPSESIEMPVQPVSSSASSTMYGQAVGTPAYMPPEQAAGHPDEVGPASDVYSLGATLYHLVAGVPPFPGFNAMSVIRQVLSRDFLPPRQVKRDVPRPLEAVILKAMAAKPEDRYASAAAMANDVERWLADEPVSADAEPAHERAGRWARRHRTLVSGLVVLVLTALLGAGVGLYFVGKERNEAKRNLALAQKAVDDCFLVATEDPRLQTERTQGVRKLLLEKALPYYERFEIQRPNDRDVQEELGRNHFRVAVITEEIGRHQDAQAAYERARHVFGALATRYPREDKYRSDLARTCNNLGNLQSESGLREPARASYELARELREQLADGGDAEMRAELASTLNNLGRFHDQSGEPAQARDAFKRARDVLKALADAQPTVDRYRAGLAATDNNLGLLLCAQKDFAGAEAAYESARKLREKLARGEKETGRRRADLADTLLNDGVLRSETGQLDDADLKYAKARDLFATLAQEFPDVAEYRSGLASAFINLGALKQAQNLPDKALELYQQADEIQRVLVANNPEVVRFKMDLAGTRLEMGDLRRQKGQYDEAAASYGASLEALRAAPRAADQPKTQALARKAHEGRAKARHKLGRHREAVADWDAALEREDGEKGELRLGRATSLALAGDYREAMSEFVDLQKDKSSAGDRFYGLACVASLSSAAARKDGAERWAAEYAKAAVEALDRAWRAKLFADAEMAAHLGRDTDLDPIRGREDFKAFLRRVEAKPGG